MRKSITVLIAFVLIFGLSAVSFAAEKTAAPAEKPATSMEAVKKINGHIGTIDMKAGTLTVKEKKAELTVVVDSETKILAGHSKKTLADLKSGEKIRVKYEIVDGKNIAKRIDVITVVSSKPPVPAEKKAEEKSPTPAKATR
jgi:Cu/Ag efflux protein CusF